MSKFRRTKGGHDPLVVVSALQKSLRRADAPLAAWSFAELADAGYRRWAWRRLLVVSAEDVGDLVTREILALADADEREHKARRGRDTRVFWSKAICILARAGKNRDADHLTNLVLDAGAVTDDHIADLLDEAEALGAVEEFGDHVFDCHTSEGRRRGRTRADFFRDEHAALHPRLPGLFDHLAEGE